MIFNLCGGVVGWLLSSFVVWVAAFSGCVHVVGSGGCSCCLVVVRGRVGWVSVPGPGSGCVGGCGGSPGGRGQGRVDVVGLVLPGAESAGCEWPCEAGLGVGGEDQPGPAVGCLGGSDFRCGPAEGLLEQTEGVLDVEASQAGLPEAVGVLRSGGVGA